MNTAISEVRELLKFWENFPAKLTPKEQIIFNHYLNRESYREIARITKTTTKSVDNAMQRIMRKLRGK